MSTVRSSSTPPTPPSFPPPYAPNCRFPADAAITHHATRLFVRVSPSKPSLRINANATSLTHTTTIDESMPRCLTPRPGLPSCTSLLSRPVASPRFASRPMTPFYSSRPTRLSFVLCVLDLQALAPPLNRISSSAQTDATAHLPRTIPVIISGKSIFHARCKAVLLIHIAFSASLLSLYSPPSSQFYSLAWITDDIIRVRQPRALSSPSCDALRTPRNCHEHSRAGRPTAASMPTATNDAASDTPHDCTPTAHARVSSMSTSGDRLLHPGTRAPWSLDLLPIGAAI
ncbi:hypothetical protein B0H13DRAFT_2375051 [Mycena leptocephala]|nr:hypothetical protein B0H13DRAFT_2375051 [Mycena leptocephala]